MSPAQNAFLELKLAAIRYLEYEEFLQLIGEIASEKRYNVVLNFSTIIIPLLFCRSALLDQIMLYLPNYAKVL